MSAYLKKGITVWILGFLTFMAALNTFHAVDLWTVNGGEDYILETYLLSNITGGLRITTYFWVSTALTFIFLGLTAIVAYRKPPLDPALTETFLGIEGNMMASRNKLEEQGKTILDMHEELFTMIESIGNVKKETLTELEKQRRTMRKVAQLSRLNTKTIEKEMSRLMNMKTKLKSIEKRLTPLQPKITSLDKPEKIRGIGPHLGDALRAIGITSVGELITTDPAIIAVKTRLSQEAAKHLQATAQLQMVPGVGEIDAKLLKEVGVSTIRELARQDPIQLSRKIAEIAKTYAEQGKIDESEKPSVEEVMSWVKHAHPLKRSCFG
jgi:predicted flap endonuclease-1-like 5' DNA nuclease